MPNKYKDIWDSKCLGGREAFNLVLDMIRSLNDMYDNLTQIEVKGIACSKFRVVVKNICEAEFICKGYIAEGIIHKLNLADDNIKVSIDEGFKDLLNRYKNSITEAEEFLKGYGE